MAQTGTEFLTKLKAEAAANQFAVIFETTFAVALTVIMVMVSVADVDMPRLREFGAVLLWSPIIVWAGVAFGLYRLAYRAYRRRFLDNLQEGGLLLTLLDVPLDANFHQRVRSFVRGYYRQAAARGLRAYPRGWRAVSIALVAAAIASWIYFLIVVWLQVNNALVNLEYDSTRLLAAGCLAVLTSVLFTVIDRPRTTALRGAIAEALLRRQP